VKLEVIHRHTPKGIVMKTQTAVRYLKSIAIALIAACVVSAPASARGGGGGHGGGGGGGGHFGGGAHSWGSGRGYSGHNGFSGYRGGAAWRGRYGDYRGGYGWRGGWGGWGGLGLGLYFATLPLYYSTLWWDGVPYYYADDNYYLWNSSADEYETVLPPPQVVNQVVAQQPVTELFAYPKNGQSAEQAARDKQECLRWAAQQSGFEPTQSSAAKRGDYLRAQAACLDARGYTVK
jgi:hypothetical protein